jgi:hypothetical protein
MLIPQVLTLVTTVHELIEVNYQRIMACQLALAELSDSELDLQLLVTIDKQCQQNIFALSVHVPGYTEDKQDVTNNRNVLNSIWNNLKILSLTKNTRSLLTYCKFCEEAAEKTYFLYLENKIDNRILEQLVVGQLLDIARSRNIVRSVFNV